MEALKALIAREPAVVIGLVPALLAVAASFGLAVNEEQAAAITALVAAAVAVAGSFVTRSKVSPVEAPVEGEVEV